MMLQLNPMIPVYVDNGRVKGEGFAFLVTHYSQEHHALWTVAMDKTGEIWEVANPEVRFCWNLSMQRKPGVENYLSKTKPEDRP